MLIPSKLKGKILKAIASETQAVGIYQAEIYWANDRFKNKLKEILSEETEHLDSLKKFILANDMKNNLLDNKNSRLILGVGWLIGTLLSLSPKRFCFWLHFRAEKKASREYKALLKDILNNQKFQSLKNFQLKQSILKSIRQEKKHSEYFYDLLKN